MFGFNLSLQTFVQLLFIILRQVFCDNSCWPPSNKQSDIYQNKRYNNGSHLTCIESVGLSMCVNLCGKTVGCKVVNFDSYQSQCSLVAEPRVITEDDMVTAEAKDFVAVLNESTVSYSSIISLSFYFPHGKLICAIWRHGISTNSGDSYGHILCSTHSGCFYFVMRGILFLTFINQNSITL